MKYLLLLYHDEHHRAVKRLQEGNDTPKFRPETRCVIRRHETTPVPQLFLGQIAFGDVAHHRQQNVFAINDGTFEVNFNPKELTGFVRAHHSNN